MSKRVHYIDALRVLAVLLLIPFHSARVFDTWEPFYAKNPQLSAALSWFVAVVSVWHMPILFLLAGASTYFALRKRSSGQYLGERAVRLLVPFVFGVAVFIPIQTWYGARTNVPGFDASYLAYWPTFFRFDTSTSDYFGGFGFGHLWFILFLFVIATVSLPLLRWCQCDRGRAFVGRLAERPIVPMMLIAMLALMVSVALPALGGHEFFFYLVFFVFGFLLMAEEILATWVRARAWVLLGIGLIVFVPAAILYSPAQELPDLHPLAIGAEFLYLLTAWLLTLAILGLGMRFLDRPFRGLGYAGEASYPFYIWHQTVIVVLGFYLVRLAWPVAVKFVVLVVLSLVVSWALYEVLVRRIPPSRFLFGMRPLERPPASGSTPGINSAGQRVRGGVRDAG